MVLNWETILKAPGNPPQFGEGHKIKPEHGTRVAGGEISLQELRTALEEIKDNKPDLPEEREDSLILSVFPQQKPDGEIIIEIGLFSYTGLIDYFGQGKTKLMISMGNKGPFGVFWINEEYVDGAWQKSLPGLRNRINQGLEEMNIRELIEGDSSRARELLASLRGS